MVGVFYKKDPDQTMSEKHKIVLVTGATGFIGHHVCRDLLSAGFKVRVLTRGKTSLNIVPHPNLEVHFGDLLNANIIASLCADVGSIIHLAGHAHTNNVHASYMHKLNVLGTESLVAGAISQGVEKFIFISSSLAQAAERNDKRATTYGLSKLKAERVLMCENDKGNIKAVILRPVNVYGEGMRGNISTLISLISSGLIPRLPQLDTRLSLLGVDDLIQAIRLVMDLEKANGETYVVTDGEKYSISSIEKAIYKALGKKIPSWGVPRILLYILMLSIHIITRFLSLIKLCPSFLENLGLKTYYNLVSENIFDNYEICKLGFKPKSTFYGSLPRIVDTYDR